MCGRTNYGKVWTTAVYEFGLLVGGCASKTAIVRFSDGPSCQIADWNPPNGLRVRFLQAKRRV